MKAATNRFAGSSYRRYLAYVEALRAGVPLKPPDEKET
jgi:hypothetical protein